MTYELHPLCTLFPRVTGAEFDALVADIRANGLRQPIVIHDGMVLDGGNRYRACIEAGVDPKFVPFDGESAVAFVLSANLHRRHLSPGQQAAIVASAQDWAKAHTHGGDKKSDQAATLPLDSVAKRAAESGASERTQRMADKVARQAPELAKKVAHGEISLPKAVEQIENKPAKKEKRSFQASAPAADVAQELEEARHAIVDLSQEVDRLRDRLAVESMDASEEEKTTAAEIIASLREQIEAMERDMQAMRMSRDTYQRENGELKKQIAMLQRQLKKVEA